MSRSSESDTDYERCNCNKCIKKRREKSYERNICRKCYEKNQNCKKKEICNCYDCRNNDYERDNCYYLNNSNSNNSNNNNNKCIKKDECKNNKTIIITIN